MAMRLTSVLGTIALASLLPSLAFAERFVVVGGERMSPEQVAFLDAAACARIPDGRYWVLPNGAWGYEGVPVAIGFVGEQCGARDAPRRKSLSERGLLYSPGELLR